MTEERMKELYRWAPLMYATYYGTMKEIALKYGYTLAIHGTVSRDFDLLAVPWIEEPGDHMEMLKDMAEAVG